MSFSWKKTFTIAQREYLTTVRRKAFLFTIFGTPALYAVLMTLMIRPQMGDRARQMHEFHSLGVVDSSGVFTDAEPEIVGTVATDFSITSAQVSKRDSFRIVVRMLADQAEGERALHAGEVNQLLVVPAGYLESGRLRRYALSTNIFSSQDERAVSSWVVRSLLRGRIDPERVARVTSPARGMELLTPDPHDPGVFERHDERREMVDFLLPFAFGMLMGLCIVIGGQYLLQGVAEEKESRILESMLCSVTPAELLAGKMLGLGSAGLTLVGVWILAGAFSSAGVLSFIHVSVPASLLVLGLLYFLFGYVFYASIMMAVGALTSNLREATQFSGYLTLLNVCPFWAMFVFINTPNSPFAVGMSLFPPTAATSMMLRMSASAVSGAVIPPWQIATSLGLLALSGVITLMMGSKLFRLGMLLYGKTPNLPEIMRILRQP